LDYTQTLALFRSQELTPAEKINTPDIEIPDSVEELEALFNVTELLKTDLDLGSELEVKFSTRQKIAILYSQPLVCNLDYPLVDDVGVDTEETFKKSICEGVIKVFFIIVLTT
jgi:hypothetical protein